MKKGALLSKLKLFSFIECYSLFFFLVSARNSAVCQVKQNNCKLLYICYASWFSQNDRNPTYTTYTIQENEDFPNSCQTTQITEVTADVHRNTVFDLFPAIRGTDQGVWYVAMKPHIVLYVCKCLSFLIFKRLAPVSCW